MAQCRTVWTRHDVRSMKIIWSFGLLARCDVMGVLNTGGKILLNSPTSLDIISDITWNTLCLCEEHESVCGT